jgi:HPt (histidine-containing phosphotransfer) domain-containing protein
MRLIESPRAALAALGSFGIALTFGKDSLTIAVKERLTSPVCGARIYRPFGAAVHGVSQVPKMVAGENVMAALSLLVEQGPERTDSVLDDDHLGRMTLGDRDLEREVLEIFARQTTLSLNRLVGAEPARAAAVAHTLKGSARGVGAWRVARAAERLEQAAADKVDTRIEDAIAQLEVASIEVRETIGARLGDRFDEIGANTCSQRPRDQ